MKIETCEYDKCMDGVRYVQKRIQSVLERDVSYKIGIICGSGLGDIVDIIENPIMIPYADIPHFPRSTVAGHSGQFVFGEKNGVPIVCMHGRVHLYEGYNVVECIRPIRVMSLLGVEILCVTNAAGNVNENYKPGQFMIIKDHISFPSLAGENPLRGKHDPRFGDRFVTMSNAYDSYLIEKFQEASVKVKLDQNIKKGIYAMVVGPTYETVAEANALKKLGADAIGMSTVHEIITAHQMGVRCLGISLLTNNILIDYDSTEDITEHEQVVEMAKAKSRDFIKLILEFINMVRIDMKI